MEREREGLFENPEWHIDSLYSLTPDRGLECNRIGSVDVNFLFARYSLGIEEHRLSADVSLAGSNDQE